MQKNKNILKIDHKFVAYFFLICYYYIRLSDTKFCGCIAQLARAFGSYPTGQWFKSVCSHQTWPHGLKVRTSPFHGGNMGSNPVGVTKKKNTQHELCVLFLVSSLGIERYFAKSKNRSLCEAQKVREAPLLPLKNNRY